jgi:hypothetical protein
MDSFEGGFVRGSADASPAVGATPPVR